MVYIHAELAFHGFYLRLKPVRGELDAVGKMGAQFAVPSVTKC